MHKVCLSPSNQEDNIYAYGNTTESVICNKIANACYTALTRCGVDTIVVHNYPLSQKCALSDNFGAELHVPIHTNAFNHKVSGTRMFSYDTNGKGYKACKAIANYLFPLSIGESDNITANTTLYEIRNVKAPTAYVECEFHDVAEVAKWIIEHVEQIGEAIAHGICDYFGVKYVAVNDNIKPKTLYKVQLGAFAKEENAKALLNELHNKGYSDAFIVKSNA